MSIFEKLKNPSLPQNDSSSAREKRAEQLASAQKDYIWTTNMPNVVGVPMSQTVPSDDKPTIAWLGEVVEVVLGIIENSIANGIEGNHGKLEELQAIQARFNLIKKTHAQKPHEGFLGQIEQEINRIKQLFVSDMGYVMKDMEKLQSILASQYANQRMQTASSLASYQGLFNTIKLNPVTKQFQEDHIFTYLRIAGPNAMLISNIRVLPEKLAITNDGYQSVMGYSDSLAKALAEQRLFLLDYHELQALADKPGNYNGLPKQLFAPIALFARPVDGNDLLPVAIQRTQKAGEYPVIYATRDKTSTGFWPWQTAKNMVNMADGNYHELFVHLARTHLLIEAFTVATHRNLARNHPLNVLLLPHFEGTLFINNSAADSLIAPQGPIDEIFASEITQTQTSAGADRLAYDFYDNMLPNDLQRRGVADSGVLPNYPYRDDALLIWDAIQKWVTEYISVYYNDDDAVRADTELAAWVAELCNQGKVKGFRPIVSRQQLAEVITMIIFTASAQHAAVNFPQSSIMTYAPAISGAVWGKYNPAGENQQEWLDTLAPVSLAAKQLDLLHLLGGVYYRMLGNYQSNNFPYPQWFTDARISGQGNALQRFQHNLGKIENEINHRNQHRTIPYTYLLPSKIPMSINI